MSRRRTTLIELVTIAGFCAFLFYFGLAAFGLVGADEPRYAQIAREMLARRDLVTPTLYGKPWLEKPPLYYWRAMESYWALGVSDWAARLPSATAASFMVAVIYFFLRRFRPGTAAQWRVDDRCLGWRDRRSRAAPARTCCWRRRSSSACWRGSRGMPLSAGCGLLLFYFFMALGALAKGPVAPLLAALIIVIFALAQRDARLITRTLWLPGILLFLAVSLPWYVAVQLQNPQFLREFIFQHNLGRFASNMYHHRQPFWYFVPVLLLGVMPWTALVIAGWVETIKQWREQPATREATLSKFLLIWTVVVLVFFSISASKLPGYILPAVPACTILAADWVSRRERLGWAVVIAQGVLSGSAAGTGAALSQPAGIPAQVPGRGALAGR